MVIGGAARFYQASSLGLIHFDEGVYAISGMWSTLPEISLYPKQILFSPPTFFTLIGVSYRILGGAMDIGAILPNLTLGLLTIPLAWWTTRLWFGSRTALAAAGFVALNGTHILYSRMALTDATFLFFFIAGISLLVIAVEQGTIKAAVLAGLAVGAAWNTKYHGWLPLVIVGSGILLVVLRFDRDKQRILIGARQILIAGSVAGLSYLPWLLFVQLRGGGYLNLLRYQQTYFSESWFTSLKAHIGTQLYLDDWITRLSPAIALIAAGAPADEKALDQMVRIAFLGLVFSLAAFLLTSWSMLLFLGGLGAIMTLRKGDLGSWVWLMALLILSVMTPFYRPYPRLVLPWLFVWIMMSAAGIQTLTDAMEAFSRNLASTWWRVGLAFLAGLVFLTFFLSGKVKGVKAYTPTDSIRIASQDIAAQLPEGAVAMVHGEPAVAYYLMQEGVEAHPIDHPIDNPAVASLIKPEWDQLFLVTGIYAERRDPSAKAGLERLKDRLTLMGTFSVRPNAARLLNDFSPSSAMEFDSATRDDYNLHLYLVALDIKTEG